MIAVVPRAVLGSGSSGQSGGEQSGQGQSSGGQSGGEQSGGGQSGGEQSGESSKTKSAKNGIENLGIAVFKDDKLVGKLTAEETLAHLLTTSELKSCNISIPNPENEENKIDLFITPSYVTKINSFVINDIPLIKLNLSINSKISSIGNISSEMTEEKLGKIEDSASNYLKNLLSNYLYKTSKEFHSDIAGLGKYALKDFKTMKEFEEYDWLNHYQDAFFEVEVTVNIDSGFLITGT